MKMLGTIIMNVKNPLNKPSFYIKATLLLSVSSVSVQFSNATSAFGGSAPLSAPIISQPLNGNADMVNKPTINTPVVSNNNVTPPQVAVNQMQDNVAKNNTSGFGSQNNNQVPDDKKISVTNNVNVSQNVNVTSKKTDANNDGDDELFLKDKAMEPSAFGQFVAVKDREIPVVTKSGLDLAPINSVATGSTGNVVLNSDGTVSQTIAQVKTLHFGAPPAILPYNSFASDKNVDMNALGIQDNQLPIYGMHGFNSKEPLLKKINPDGKLAYVHSVIPFGEKPTPQLSANDSEEVDDSTDAEEPDTSTQATPEAVASPVVTPQPTVQPLPVSGPATTAQNIANSIASIANAASTISSVIGGDSANKNVAASNTGTVAASTVATQPQQISVNQANSEVASVSSPAQVNGEVAGNAPSFLAQPNAAVLEPMIKQTVASEVAIEVQKQAPGLVEIAVKKELAQYNLSKVSGAVSDKSATNVAVVNTVNNALVPASATVVPPVVPPAEVLPVIGVVR